MKIKKVIAYKLENGTTPNYVSTISGYYKNNNYFVGVSLDDAILPSDVIVFNAKEELSEYLNPILENWTYNPSINIPIPTLSDVVDSLWV